MKEFWRWLTTSRYTRRLEDENARLTEENGRLLRLLLPRLAPTIGERPESRIEDGRGVHEANPDHRNADTSPRKFKRTNWTEARNKLEVLTDQSIQTEQRMQKAVNAHANL